jgi:hypothetical protein
MFKPIIGYALFSYIFFYRLTITFIDHIELDLLIKLYKLST